ncbi:oligopeptidase A [Enterobacter cloacae]|uniref:Oligopeptidase A n=1 Tax=Enterobacter cloacae TaxID=550 RepID=A0A377LQV4_ENTCL|nr:oligopeptidase A [Enterobacter cloacae]
MRQVITATCGPMSWRRMLSLALKKRGIFNRETGQSFLDNILTRGGSEEPMELFKRFRGREPQLDAMLEHYGIKG